MSTTNLDGAGARLPRTTMWCYVCPGAHPFHGYTKASREVFLRKERQTAIEQARAERT